MRYALTSSVMVAACGGAGPIPTMEPTRPSVEPAGTATATVTSSPPAPPPAAPPPSPPPTPAPDGADGSGPPRTEAVTVTFVVAPRVGPTPPTMTVTVHNPNARPVPLVRFDTPACFARHYLDVSLRRPDGKPATKKPCVRTDERGTTGELAPAAGAVIELPFAELFTGWPAGRYDLEVDWDPAVLEAARPGIGIQASTTSLSATSFAIATARSTFRIARGASVALPGGPTLTFRAHGHKRTLEGGPPSPLIIYATLAPASAAPREVSVNLHLREGRLFWLDELAFELVGHAYNDWMELRYFGPLTLRERSQ